ncbi:MAG: Spy/CpxP family protein refolding chaperone [Candidatus Aminicenantales bacterium]
MKKQILALLIIVAFFSLSFIPLAAQPEVKRRPGLFMSREDFLGLTQEQKDKLGELRKARMEARRELIEKMRHLRQNLRQLLQDPKASEKKIGSIIDEMTKLRADFMKSGIKHGREVEKVFTPEQLEKLKAMKERFATVRFRARLRAFRREAFLRGRHFMPHRHFYRPWRRGWWY